MTVYKPLEVEKDITTVKTKVHEVIPVTGSIVSGTYTSDGNVKAYTHGMFKSIYDYPYLSSSANHLFDITAGVMSTGVHGSSGALPVSASNANKTEKTNIYTQMAKVLFGTDATGSIRNLDHLGELTSSTTNKFNSAVFLNFSRLLTKDEIQKESFSLTFGTGAYATPFGGTPVTISDLSAVSSYKSNSPAGDYGILYTGSVATNSAAVGLVFYQAGIAALELSSSAITGLLAPTTGFTSGSTNGILSHSGSMQSASLDECADGLRRRLQNISFRNTTELNSTVYFCRANHNEFNYSSNPTYLSASAIRVKNNDPGTPPVSYITTIGLYGADNELLAVAKLSEPIKKSPANDFTIRVRLDY